MDKLIKLPAFVAVFAALALAGMIGIFALNAAPQAVEAQATSNASIAVSGTEQEGKTLTATITLQTGGSLDTSQTVRWIRVDGSTETIIPFSESATVAETLTYTYKLTSDDVGKRVKAGLYANSDNSLVVASMPTAVITEDNTAPMLTQSTPATQASAPFTFTLRYNEPLSEANILDASAFLAWSGSTAVPISAGAPPVVSGMTVTVTTNAAADTLSYSAPSGTGAIQDLAGNMAESLSAWKFQAKPDMPTILEAVPVADADGNGTANDPGVKLTWKLPRYSGSDAIDAMQYRVRAKGTDDFSDDSWVDIGTSAALQNDGTLAEANSVMVTLATSAVAAATEGATFQVRAYSGGSPSSADDNTAASDASNMVVAMTEAVVDEDEVETDLSVPNKPNKQDEVELMFHSADGIDAGDYITIVLHEDFQVPDDIAESQVSLSGDASNVPTDSSAQKVFGVTPVKVTVDDTDSLSGDFGNDADWLIQIQIPDTLSGDQYQGNQGLMGNITVTIEKAAGIRAPKEAGEYAYGFLAGEKKSPDSNSEVMGLMTQPINRLVELSEEKKGRGATIEATAKGFEVGTVYFWRDGNLNGAIDATEDVLCHANVDDDHVATCEFELTNPPFQPGIGTCGSRGTDCNLVQAHDGANRSNIAVVPSTADLMDSEAHENEDNVIFLDKSISISPEGGNPGDKITLTLRDFPRGSITSVTIGGERAHFTPATVSSGGATSTVTIPDRAQTGVRQFVVNASGTDDDTEIIIGGAELTATPETVIPGQDVVLTGSGYFGGSCIPAMTLGGIVTEFEGCTGRNAVEADNNGNWSYTVEIPVNATTADAEGGTLTMRVADRAGRVGSLQLPFMAREVTMTPSEGHPGTPMVLQGSGFPVDADVDVQYGDERADGVDADSGGSWRHTMKVPDDVGIPSTNVVTVSFDAGTETVTETFTHRVPGASIMLDPAMGPEGGLVSMTAGGFDRFTSLDELMVDGRTVSVSPAPSTDRNGNVTFTFQIPGADPGVVNVAATFDDTTASTTFTVTEGRGVVDGSVETIMADVISMEALDRVFLFDNDTKEWLWYINDPAFSATNNLTGLSSGDLVWIKVTKSVTADVLGQSLTLTCINEGADNEDCWNQVSIP